MKTYNYIYANRKSGRINSVGSTNTKYSEDDTRVIHLDNNISLYPVTESGSVDVNHILTHYLWDNNLLQKTKLILKSNSHLIADDKIIAKIGAAVTIYDIPVFDTFVKTEYIKDENVTILINDNNASIRSTVPNTIIISVDSPRHLLKTLKIIFEA